MAEKFTDQVCQQLDQSVDALDPALMDQLASARQKALTQMPKPKAEPSRFLRPMVYWPAMAAALMVMVIVPNVPRHSSGVVAPDVVIAANLYEMEPDLLDTMDLLWAVEDLAEREMNAL